MKYIIDIPEILLDRIKSAKCVPDMYGSDIVNTVVCVRDATPYKDRPHGEWVQTYYSIDGVGASRFKCSKCENEIRTYGKPYNFCPKCGSDNRKREETKQ